LIDGTDEQDQRDIRIQILFQSGIQECSKNKNGRISVDLKHGQLAEDRVLGAALIRETSDEIK
jgi:hypothetical protein